jgi:hypothetical protein
MPPTAITAKFNETLHIILNPHTLTKFNIPEKPLIEFARSLNALPI